MLRDCALKVWGRILPWSICDALSVTPQRLTRRDGGLFWGTGVRGMQGMRPTMEDAVGPQIYGKAAPPSCADAPVWRERKSLLSRTVPADSEERTRVLVGHGPGGIQVCCRAQLPRLNGWAFFGVFDGHAGSEAAGYASQVCNGASGETGCCSRRDRPDQTPFTPL